MKYFSTRGGAGAAGRPFLEILLEGLAPDGGLYVPEQYPQLTPALLERWRGLDYAELAFEVLSLFATDMPADDLRALCRTTYTTQVYGHSRDAATPAITPLRALGEEHGAPLALLELSNGPTLAFKDMAMQLLGGLFEYQLDRQGARLNIVGATSGDTGSAAEHALRGKRGISVFMLSPHGRMSPFQTAQMYGLQDDNIHNLAIEGVFDDAQDIVKLIGTDVAFKARHAIGSVNSINWGRIAAQVVYYVHAWLGATRSPDQQVSFAVPSGNFGNICAGHIARMMGLPIRRLVCATNENDVLDEFFRTGRYRVRPGSAVHQTSSPSMDIAKASNFERFVFDLVDRDADRVKALWRLVEIEGGFTLNDAAMAKVRDRFGFVSGASSHGKRIATIRDVQQRYGVTIDPHTADGVQVAREFLEPGVPMIVLETAQPAKFSAAIVEALGHEPARPDAFIGIERLPQRFTVLPATVEAVRDYLATHADRVVAN
ncbi:threonine synthase [soil metagenome]